MPLCLLKGFDAGGLGLAAVDLASAEPEESEEVEDPEPPKEKRDLDLLDCELWVFTNGTPLELVEELTEAEEPDQRLLKAHVEVAVEEEAAESREDVRKRFMVPRVRISSADKESTFRVGWRRPRDFPLLFGGVEERVEAELSMEDVGVREWELEPERDAVERLKGLMERGGFNHADGGAGADADLPTGGRAVVSRITGEEPTLDIGEYSLGVAVLGLEVVEADEDEFEDR